MTPIDANLPIQQNAVPWPELPNVVGDLCHARTIAGRQVRVWRPNQGLAVRHRYWCHGHSTLTFHLYGYSIIGQDMPLVLQDEWTRIPKKPEFGDIVVWYDDNGNVQHSARIEEAEHWLGFSSIKRCSSKNGPRALRTGLSVETIQQTYNQYNWRTPDPGCCCCCCTVKQYYRRNNRMVGLDLRFP